MLDETILKNSKIDNTTTKFLFSSEHNPNREIAYYHREYSNDFLNIDNKVLDTIIRVVIVTLPFISLYKPAGIVISLTMDALRTFTNIRDFEKNVKNKEYLKSVYSIFATTISIISIAAVIFHHPAAMLIITSHDALLNSIYLIKAVKDKNAEKIIKNTIQILNNILYAVSLFFGFSLELQIASLSMQVIYELFSSINEGRKGNYIECIGHLGMLGVRSGQLYSQYMMLKRKLEIEKRIKNIFVGKLHEKWQFPSDHLPIGVEVDGIEVISWNVLNNKYIEWVYKDSQGLNGSMITDLDFAIQDNGFTKRDALIINMINQMANKSEKRGIIALQECSDPFLKKLENSLPANWGIVKSSNKSQHDQNIILYNKEKLSYNKIKSTISSDAYPCQKGRSLMNILFYIKGKQPFRIFNSHIPGDPNLPGRYEFVKYIKEHSTSEEVIIALGDMNFERKEMIDAIRKQNLSDYLIHSPYHTNVDPYTKESKCIDHIFVIGENVKSKIINSKNIGIGLLQPLIDILSGRQNNNKIKLIAAG